MSKTSRISNRIKRIEDRFKTKVSKGRKGTDMDIEIHERRIEKLWGKHREETLEQEKNMPSGFIMPHSPLNYLNNGNKKYKKGDLLNENDWEEGDYISTNKGKMGL